MVYRFFYFMVNILIRVFYRRIYISGLDHIKKDQAYLITSNHPNGFFEPLIMACTFPIDLYFLVRGDLFENPISNWFLRSTHQIPIFRFVDGFSKMKENQSSMSEATQKLSEAKSILIFAEGSTDAVLKLRPIQKGTAKLAFQAMDEHHDINIQILPVGINFSNFRSPGSEVILNIGEPFDVKEFYTSEDKERPRAIRSLTKSIEASMDPLILNIEKEENENILRKAWQLSSVLHSKKGRVIKESQEKHQSLRQLAIEINKNTNISSQVEEIHDFLSNSVRRNRIMGVKKLPTAIYFLLGFPGMMFYAIPVLFGRWMRKT